MDMFQTTGMPLLSHVAVIFFNSAVVITLNGNFYIVPLLLSVSVTGTCTSLAMRNLF